MQKRLNLINRQFGLWNVLELSKNKNNSGGRMWKCQCACGRFGYVSTGNLNNNISKNCGQCVNDLTNKRFGKLVVVGLHSKRYHGSKHWICKCDCGNQRLSTKGDLEKWVKNCGCELRVPEGEAAFNALFSRYRLSAERRKYSFNLTKEEFRTFTKSNCHYCGTPPIRQARQKGTNGNYTYNGIDRKDNNQGYKVSNCKPCCKTCNLAKLDLSTKDFKEWIIKVYNNFAEKKKEKED